jgi:raffinose/stachyose/melibiose transport system substrate-binding protein
VLRHIFPASDGRNPAPFSLARVLLPLFLLLGLLLAACGGSTGTGSADQNVTLKLIQWSNQPAVDAVKQINADFHKKYPNITVSMTTVPTANDQYLQLQNTRLAANDVDVMATQGFVGSPPSWATGASKPTWQQWIEAGQLLDLTSQPFVNNYYPQALKDASTFNGKIYSVTTGSYADSGVFYNKAIFAKYNLQVPTTFSELMHVAQVLQSHGVTPFVIGGKDTWPLSVATFGVQASLLNQEDVVKGLWTGNVKFTDAQNVEVLRRMQQIMQYTQKNFMGLDYGTSGSYFASEKAAMIPDGTWDAPAFTQANPSLQFGYFPMPGSDTASANTKLAGKYDLAWVVNAKSNAAHRDAALKWLSFFSQSENYAKYVNGVGILPSQPNVNLQSAFLKEIQPLAQNLVLAWDQLTVGKKEAGKYANGVGGINEGFQIQYLAPAGPIASPADLAAKTQADWDAAK